MIPSAPALDSLPLPGATNNRFHTEISPLAMEGSSTLSTVIRFLFERNNRTPDIPLPCRRANLTPFSRRRYGEFNSTWLGHSSLMINMDGFRILLDPVFEEKVSIVGPKRFNGPVRLNIRDLPDIDLVIISHDHYDHLNKRAVKALRDKTACFIVPLKVDKHLKAWGIPASKIVALNWWQSYKPAQELTVTATPGQHFSGRGLTDRNRTLWSSWVIASPNFNIFFSGDSGYFDGFSIIGDRFGPFDMTFLECGAYDPSWHGVHMYPEETARAHMDLKGKILHPIHWGAFNLAFHPWYDPMVRLSAAAKTNGIAVATPMAGQTITLTDLGGPWWDIHRTANSNKK